MIRRPNQCAPVVGTALLLAVCMFLPTTVRAADASSADPFEPTVTESEAAFLQDAVALADRDPAAAVATLQERISDSTSPAFDFALGNLYYRDGQMIEAERAYLAAIDKFPMFRGARNNLARVHYAENDTDRAIAVFQSLLRDGLGDAETYLLLGHCLLLQGQPVSAEGAYRQALVLSPGDRDAMRGLATSLIEQGRNTEVLFLAKEMQIQAPYDAELWSLRANAHLSLDQLDGAITSIETARFLGAARPALLATLGDLYLNREQPRDAVRAYREAFAGHTPGVDRLLRAIQGLLQLRALDEAEDLLARIRAVESEGGISAEQGLRRDKLEARLVAVKGNVGSAIARYTSVIRMDPLAGDAMLDLADLQMSIGRVEEASLWLERAARIHGYEARALVRHAQLDVEQDDFDAAVDLLERAQAFDEQPHVARYLEQVRRLAGR